MVTCKIFYGYKISLKETAKLIGCKYEKEYEYDLLYEKKWEKFITKMKKKGIDITETYPNGYNNQVTTYVIIGFEILKLEGRHDDSYCSEISTVTKKMKQKLKKVAEKWKFKPDVKPKKICYLDGS